MQIIKGGLLFAAYLGHMALRWAIRKRRCRDSAEPHMVSKAHLTHILLESRANRGLIGIRHVVLLL